MAPGSTWAADFLSSLNIFSLKLLPFFYFDLRFIFSSLDPTEVYIFTFAISLDFSHIYFHVLCLFIHLFLLFLERFLEARQ